MFAGINGIEKPKGLIDRAAATATSLRASATGRLKKIKELNQEADKFVTKKMGNIAKVTAAGTGLMGITGGAATLIGGFGSQEAPKIRDQYIVNPNFKPTGVAGSVAGAPKPAVTGAKPPTVTTAKPSVRAIVMANSTNNPDEIAAKGQVATPEGGAVDQAATPEGGAVDQVALPGGGVADQIPLPGGGSTGDFIDSIFTPGGDNADTLPGIADSLAPGGGAGIDLAGLIGEGMPTGGSIGDAVKDALDAFL